MKILVYFLSVLCLFVFCSCSNTNINTPQTNNSEIVASFIETNFDSTKLSDETIKALSVIVRTNEINGYPINHNKTKTILNERVLKLVKQTEDEFLTDETKQNNYISFGLQTQKTSFWKKEIKKSDILKFLNSKKISLSSISKIEPVVNEGGETEALIIGGKQIKISEIQEYFKLESNKINSVESIANSIIIVGENTPDKVDFDINSALSNEKDGADYKTLLKNQLKNWQF